MKHLSIIAVTFLLLGSALSADELVLKDGKIVPYTVMRDLGDSCEVETADGVKVEIRKDQIAKVVFKDRLRVQKEKAAATPLTGATFEWEKGRKLTQFDLMAGVDLKKDAVAGDWKLSGRTLQYKGKEGSSSGTFSGHIETNYVPANEYDLTMNVERLEVAPDTGICIALPGFTGTQFGFSFDPKGWMGVLKVDGKWFDEPGGLGIRELLFPKTGIKKTIVMLVRRHGFAVKVDSKELFNWVGDWSRITRPEPWSFMKKQNSISILISGREAFKINSAIVTFPKE